MFIQVEAIAREGKYQHLIIESTGISDPTPVAEALATSASSSSGGGGDGRFSTDEDLAEDSTTGVSIKAIRDTAGATAEAQGGGGGGEGGEGEGEELVDILGTGIVEGGGEGGGGEGMYAVDTLVTVVDSTSFLDEVRKADDLEERGLEAEEGDTRTIADLLVSQASSDVRYDVSYVLHTAHAYGYAISAFRNFFAASFRRLHLARNLEYAFFLPGVVYPFRESSPQQLVG